MFGKAKNKKIVLSVGVKTCSDCEHNIRCNECVYNKNSVEAIKQETMKQVLQYIYVCACCEGCLDYDDVEKIANEEYNIQNLMDDIYNGR